MQHLSEKRVNLKNGSLKTQPVRDVPQTWPIPKTVPVSSLLFTLVEAGLSKVRAGAADTVATTNKAFFISQI